MTRYGQLNMVVIKLYNDFIRHDESSSKSNYPCYLAAVANNVFSYCRYWKSSQHVVPTRRSHIMTVTTRAKAIRYKQADRVISHRICVQHTKKPLASNESRFYPKVHEDQTKRGEWVVVFKERFKISEKEV